MKYSNILHVMDENLNLKQNLTLKVRIDIGCYVIFMINIDASDFICN